VGAGWAEETVFRGYLFDRFGSLFGRSVPANLLTLLLATVIFASLHYQQGTAGVINAGITGLIIGAIYLVNGRKLWTLMFAHASFDLTAALMIYLNLETRAAHLVFR
jgi:CAAX protease family protein